MDQIQKRPTLTIMNWLGVIALVISIINGYTALRNVGKEKIEIMTYDALGFGISNERIFINPYISIKNYGKSTGTISSIEAFIVSKAKDQKGNPKYMRHFTDVFYEPGMVDPFLGCFVYPNDLFAINAGVYQGKTDGFGSFESGEYEYLLTINDDKEKQFYNKCFELDINESQVKSILGNYRTRIKLTQLQEQNKINELLKTFESFKKPAIGFCVGNDDNDLKFGYKFTITFDPNGGTGGNASQILTSGSRGTPLAGGTPTRNGYTFKRWNSNQDGTGNSYYNGDRLLFANNITFYAVWEENSR